MEKLNKRELGLVLINPLAVITLIPISIGLILSAMTYGTAKNINKLLN